MRADCGLSVNHYKFIENNLIPEYRSSGNYSVCIHMHCASDFRCKSIRTAKQEEGNAPPPSSLSFSVPPSVETRSPIRLEVKSIFSDSNMEIQIQIYGNLFVPITLINHGYASILIPFEPTEIEVQSHSEINRARGSYAR